MSDSEASSGNGNAHTDSSDTLPYTRAGRSRPDLTVSTGPPPTTPGPYDDDSDTLTPMMRPNISPKTPTQRRPTRGGHYTVNVLMREDSASGSVASPPPQRNWFDIVHADQRRRVERSGPDEQGSSCSESEGNDDDDRHEEIFIGLDTGIQDTSTSRRTETSSERQGTPMAGISPSRGSYGSATRHNLRSPRTDVAKSPTQSSMTGRSPVSYPSIPGRTVTTPTRLERPKRHGVFMGHTDNVGDETEFEEGTESGEATDFEEDREG